MVLGVPEVVERCCLGASVLVRILIIEDDLDLVDNLAEFFQLRGTTTEFCHQGPRGLQRAQEDEWDAIVLDLGLPGLDGLELCRRLRKESSSATPLLMLTARDSLEDKVAGFEAGADDYLVKPFALLELEVRLLALQRRAGRSQSDTLLQIADLTFDPVSRNVQRDNQPLYLNRIGERLLEVLMRASPRVLPREELEKAIWGQFVPDRNLLRSHLYSLRKIIDRPFEFPLIHTVHGRGYQLVDSRASGAD